MCGLTRPTNLKNSYSKKCVHCCIEPRATRTGKKQKEKKCVVLSVSEPLGTVGPVLARRRLCCGTSVFSPLPFLCTSKTRPSVAAVAVLCRTRLTVLRVFRRPKSQTGENRCPVQTIDRDLNAASNHRRLWNVPALWFTSTRLSPTQTRRRSRRLLQVLNFLLLGSNLKQ